MSKISDVIEKTKNCAGNVYSDLGAGWAEKIYQAAMEIELRKEGIEYENQRILPVDYKGFTVGEGIPDLIIWVQDGKKRTAIVIDLKQDSAIKDEHELQVQKYIGALQRQLKQNEVVHKEGLVINFLKASLKKVDETRLEQARDVSILMVSANIARQEPNR